MQQKYHAIVPFCQQRVNAFRSTAEEIKRVLWEFFSFESSAFIFSLSPKDIQDKEY